MSNVIHIFTGRPLDPVTGALPGPKECLACYLHRMVEDGECSDTLGWTEHYRRVRAKRAVALVRRLEARGAICDCDVVTTLWQPSGALWVSDPATGDLLAPEELPACAGVRPGSTQPCLHWVEADSVAL